MRNTCIPVLLCIVVTAGYAFGQQVRRTDIFGGYSYVNIDTNSLPTSRQSANGWEAAVSVAANKWLAGEADISAYYKNNVLGSGVNASDYAFTAGPRLNYRAMFVHALFGFDHLRGSAAGETATQNGFATAIGGGVQVNITPQVAARTSADWVLTRHNILDGDRVDQNNFRVSVGLVYTFGREARQAVLSSSTAPIPTTAANVDVLGVAAVQDSHGIRVVAVLPDSAAARSGIAVQDYILTVDGAKVRNIDDLNTALRTNKSGPLKLGYEIQGKWLTEREIALK